MLSVTTYSPRIIPYAFPCRAKGLPVLAAAATASPAVLWIGSAGQIKKGKGGLWLGWVRCNPAPLPKTGEAPGTGYYGVEIGGRAALGEFVVIPVG